MWVCVLGFEFRLRRANPGPGVVVCGFTVACHLLPCRGLLRVLCASRVSGTRWLWLLGTCLYAAVVVGGVPLWRASWPRVVRRAWSCPVTLRAPVGFPVAVVHFPTSEALAPGFTGRQRGSGGGWPRTGLYVPAAGPHQGRGAVLASRPTRRGPAMGLALVGPYGVGLWLRALWWFGVCGPGH